MLGTTFVDGRCQTINIFKIVTQIEVQGGAAQGKKKKTLNQALGYRLKAEPRNFLVSFFVLVLLILF